MECLLLRTSNFKHKQEEWVIKPYKINNLLGINISTSTFKCNDPLPSLDQIKVVAALNFLTLEKTARYAITFIFQTRVKASWCLHSLCICTRIVGHFNIKFMQLYTVQNNMSILIVCLLKNIFEYGTSVMLNANGHDKSIYLSRATFYSRQRSIILNRLVFYLLFIILNNWASSNINYKQWLIHSTNTLCKKSKKKTTYLP